MLAGGLLLLAVLQCTCAIEISNLDNPVVGGVLHDTELSDQSRSRKARSVQSIPIGTAGFSKVKDIDPIPSGKIYTVLRKSIGYI